MEQLVEVRDLANSVVKSIKPPVQTNEIFYGGTASLILSCTSSVVLYDIQQQKTIAELHSPPVKYVMWSSDWDLGKEELMFFGGVWREDVSCKEEIRTDECHCGPTAHV